MWCSCALDAVRYGEVNPRERAASSIVDILTSPFLRALTEPARLDLLRVMLTQGEGDIGEISEQLPQDRSVISRHLRVLQDAGIVTGRKEGRRMVFSLEGTTIVRNLERILGEVRALAPACCPPPLSRHSMKSKRAIRSPRAT
jgi:DNA-binding transcriptional ArsR family regulator